MQIMMLGLAWTAFLAVNVGAECPTGDLNGDCRVDFKDIAILAEQWLDSPGGSANLNADTRVNMPDYGLLANNWRKIGTNVVINEIHYNPDVQTELVEFVELYNRGPGTVDLSGWYFSAGISYTFPAGVKLQANGYLVVVQDRTGAVNSVTVASKYGTPSALVFGPFTGGLNNEGERIELCNASGDKVDAVEYQLGFPWPTVGDAVPDDGQHPGTGRSIQLVNPSFDNDLGGCWRSASPTPAAKNTGVYAENIPPQIRQVKHEPKQPVSGEVVTITAKVTDPDGVQSVTLAYQIVNPGSYISLNDPQYSSDWTLVDMHNDGLNGDVTAGDDIYTMQLPGSLQTHRRLIRYHIMVLDKKSAILVVPYADDPQPNFAYFVYDGVPAWRGAINPGAPVVEYSPEVMRSLPVYHLISKKSDVETCTWLEKYMGSEYKWKGTLVYDGDVYDHISYRARGGVWRYSMGKNMWKFDFNRGHDFQARDDYGEVYKTKWSKLNFSACIQQGDYQHRGEQGMFEAVSFKLYNLMGDDASKTHWLQFRIIDESDEVGTTQYVGDFWGLYMAIEQMDGRFLDEHGLPDGNLYKMEGGAGELNNQGPTGATDKSDLNGFMAAYQGKPTVEWWQQNFNLEGYYSFRAVTEGIHNGDIGYNKNYFYYNNPETNKWSIFPWDMDLTWAENMYGNGNSPFKSRVLPLAEFNLAYKNRLREFMDLLYNPEQMGLLIDEMAGTIFTPGQISFVDVDRAMWDYNPIMTSSYVNSSKAGTGRFYQIATTKDFAGMLQLMKDYVTFATNNTRNWYGSSGPSMNSLADDTAIPNTPTINATCPPDYPSNALTFGVTAFNDPQGNNTFGAMRWRIAEVSAGSQVPPSQGGGGVFVTDGAQWKYFKGTKEPSATQGAWRQLSFDDSSWLQGQTAIGFGETFIITPLNDMRKGGSYPGYTTVYLRKTFDVSSLTGLGNLILEVKYDDGVNVWINDKIAVSENVASEEMPYTGTASSSIENYEFVKYVLGDPTQFLVRGTNIITVQVLNATISSSDCFIDVKLTAESTGGGGTTTPVTPLNYSRRPGKYEIEALWDSGELTQYNPNERIPASVVRPGRTYRVRCRMKDNTGRWSHWSSPVQFVAGEPLSQGVIANLRVTEVMYNPVNSQGTGQTNNDDFEFVELKNIGDETVDLMNVSFVEGITFDFKGSAVTTLAPGAYVLIVRNKAAFESRYGTGLSNITAGQYTGKLANEGENVLLADFWDGTVAEFEYGDGRGWPLAADGGGHSLVPLESALLGEPEGSLNYCGNWRASTYIGGSPGQDDPQPVTTVVVNEIMAHTDYTDPQRPEYDSDDWIELYNTSTSAVTLSNYYLSDDIGNLKKWALPAISIGAGGRVSFDEVSNFHNPITTGFGLDKAGEQVILSYLPGTSQDRIADAISFKGQAVGVSLGHYPDGGAYWFQMSPSRDAKNTAGIPGVVIDEIMYHPVDPNEEYIELYNPTAAAVVLDSADGLWRLNGGVDYTFPAGLSIPGGGRLVVVGFDPKVETGRLAAFTSAYGAGTLTAGVNIVGPWSGDLSNRGERIAVERPQAPDLPGDPVSWIIVDEVIYGDVPPWPETPDGGGDVLKRLNADQTHSGNDPANWKAAVPSPGSTGL
jgi:hypothetical protein